VRFGVEAAQLGQRLWRLRARARALVCGQGPKCPARQKRWNAQLRALDAVLAALPKTARKVQAAGQAALSVSRCRALLKPLSRALDAWVTGLDQVSSIE